MLCNTRSYSKRLGGGPPEGDHMQAFIRLSLVGILSIWLLGCPSVNAPNAAFSALPTHGSAPLSVQFTDESCGSGSTIDSWFWDFGDGATSTEQDPVHVYQQEGVFSVSLTIATESHEDSVIRSGLISVSQTSVNAAFSALPTHGTVPLSVQFSDESSANGSTIDSWAWDFGDDGTSTQQNPVHVYQQEGTFTVSLTVATGSHQDSVVRSQLITVSGQPVAPWAHTVDFGEDDKAFAIEPTYDGGYVVAGPTGSQTTDGIIHKMDAFGNSEWAFSFGREGLDYPRVVRERENHTLVFTGLTSSAPALGWDVYLNAISEDGEQLWRHEKTFGGSQDDFAADLCLTSDGGMVLVGGTESYGSGLMDAYVIKIDSSGNSLWSKTLGGSSSEHGRAVRETEAGDLVIAGWTASYGMGSADAYLALLDSEGTLLWQKTFGGAERDEAQAITLTADGGFVLAGETLSFGEASWSSVYLVKTDAQGEEVWARTFSEGSSSAGLSVVETSDGGFLVGGWTSGTGGYDDVYIVKTDSSGHLEWSQVYGGDWEDRASDVIEIVDEGYIIAGWTDSFFTDGDFYVLKTDLEGVAPRTPTWAK